MDSNQKELQEALRPEKSSIELQLEGQGKLGKGGEVIVVGGRNTGKTAVLKAMKENQEVLNTEPTESIATKAKMEQFEQEHGPKKNVQDIIKDMRAAAAAKWKKMTPEQKAEVRAEREAIRVYNKALRNGKKSFARTKGFKPVPSMLTLHNYGRKYGKTDTDFIIM